MHGHVNVSLELMLWKILVLVQFIQIFNLSCVLIEIISKQLRTCEHSRAILARLLCYNLCSFSPSLLQFDALL